MRSLATSPCPEISAAVNAAIRRGSWCFGAFFGSCGEVFVDVIGKGDSVLVLGDRSCRAAFQVTEVNAIDAKLCLFVSFPHPSLPS